MCSWLTPEVVFVRSSGGMVILWRQRIDSLGRRRNLFWQRGIPARFARRKRPKRTFLHAALRTAHSLRDILEPRVPSTQAAERMRLRRTLVAACDAFEDQ